MWRVADGHPVALPGISVKDVDEVAFAPDGQTFAVDRICSLELRHWPDGAFLRSFPSAESACPDHIVFAPDGQTVAGATYSGVAIWRVSDGALLRTLPEPDIGVRSMVFAPDG